MLSPRKRCSQEQPIVETGKQFEPSLGVLRAIHALSNHKKGQISWASISIVIWT